MLKINYNDKNYQPGSFKNIMFFLKKTKKPVLVSASRKTSINDCKFNYRTSPVFYRLSEEKINFAKAQKNHSVFVNELSLPEINIYKTARLAANLVCEELKACKPDIFRSIIPDFNIENTYKLRNTYKYSVRDIPYLVSFLSHTAQEKRRLIIDSSFSSKNIQTLSENIISGDISSIELINSLTFKAFNKHVHKHLSISNSQNNLTFKFEKNSTCVFIGSERELDFISPILVNKKNNKSLVFVIKNNSLKLIEAIKKKFSSHKNFNCFTLNEISVSSSSLSYFTQTKQIMLDLYRSIENDKNQEHLKIVLFDLIGMIKSSLSIYSFIQAIQPNLIIGSFEKNMLGAILSEFNKLHHNVINLQHGIIPDCPALDLVNFEKFIVWTNHDVETVARNKYIPTNKVYISGNPLWQNIFNYSKSRQQVINDSMPDINNEKEKTVVYFSQPTKWPFITFHDKKKNIEILLQYFSNQKNLNLIIKLHELESETDVKKILAANKTYKNIFIIKHEQLSLPDTLKLADIVLSISSTTLIDSIAANIPVIACNMTQTHQRAGIKLPEYVEVISDEPDFYQRMDHHLKNDRFIENSDIKKIIYPDLKSYTEKINDLF